MLARAAHAPADGHDGQPAASSAPVTTTGSVPPPPPPPTTTDAGRVDGRRRGHDGHDRTAAAADHDHDDRAADDDDDDRAADDDDDDRAADDDDDRGDHDHAPRPTGRRPTTTP